jgi:EAL domain-containing protein (putative c-di-GMP-specific phosphodiesterase class I)
VLLVDDDPRVRAAFAQVLSSAGFLVQTAAGAVDAWQQVMTHNTDVVITDIQMPGMTGVELLQRLHDHDADLPVILVTGNATLDSAIRAVQDSAFSYLTKPMEPGELIEHASRAAAHRTVTSHRTRAVAELARAQSLELEQHANLEADFEAALETLTVAFQPIVRASGEVFGYEALLRTGSAKFRSPPELLNAAERLGGLERVGRAVRARAAHIMQAYPGRGMLFVNLHARDLLDEDLFAADAPLTRIASRVVLEITERASIDSIRDLTRRIEALRARGFAIAVDDLGAGYAGLASVAQLEPEIIKLDMSLVREIDRSQTKQRLVGSLVAIAGHLGALVVAEGVETCAERDVLIDVGCHLLQGYLFARPGPPFPRLARSPMSSATPQTA